MNCGPSGFSHAPLSKSIVLATVIASALTQSGRIPPASIPARFLPLTRFFAFHTPGELLFGGLLLYWFRYIERQNGSAKYAVFATSSTAIAGVLHWVLKSAFQPNLSLPWGPYALVFASFVSFVVDVPAAHSYSLPLLRLKSSEKIYVYLAGLQLLFCWGRRSLLAGLLGFVSGCVYQLNVLGIRRWKLPRFMVKVMHKLAGTQGQQVFVSATRPSRDQVAAAAAFAAGHTAPVAAAAANTPPGTAVVPSQQAVDQLLQMGFSEAQARLALQQTGNNLAEAIQLLVG